MSETAETAPVEAVGPVTKVAKPKKKKKRVFLWVFLAVQALFILWLITSASAGDHQTTHCVAQGLTSDECKSASEVGTGAAIAIEVVVWVVVDFLLAVTYGVYRLARRPR